MMAKKITVIPGDGIGQEITEETVRVLEKIDEIYKIGFQFEWKEAGGTAYDHTGFPLPEETIESCRKADAVLFGHTHHPLIEREGGILLVNPGSIAGRFPARAATSHSASVGRR